MLPPANLYRLLCYAWDRLDRGAPPIVAGVDRFERAVDLIGAVLAQALATLVRRQIDRSYVTYVEETRVPRGRIEFAPTLSRQLERYGRVVASFDELSADVLQNQLAKAMALRMLAVVEDADVRRSLRTSLDRMANVSRIDPSASAFRRVQLHRNNAHYAFLLEVCEMAFHHLVPQRGGSGWRFNDFTGDASEMGRVFEAFLRGFLRREQSAWKVSGERVKWSITPLAAEAAGVLPGMNTDITLVRNGVKVVLESKYYASPLRVGRFGEQRLREGHLYQVLAYVTNLNAQGGVPVRGAVLVYGTEGTSFDHRYLLGNVVIRALALNLSQPWEDIVAALLAVPDETLAAGVVPT